MPIAQFVRQIVDHLNAANPEWVAYIREDNNLPWSMIFRGQWSVVHPRAYLAPGGQIYNPHGININMMTPRLWFQVECSNPYTNAPPYEIYTPLDTRGLQPVHFNAYLNVTLPAFAANCAAIANGWVDNVPASIATFQANLNRRIELDRGNLTAILGNAAEVAQFATFILNRHATFP